MSNTKTTDETTDEPRAAVPLRAVTEEADPGAPDGNEVLAIMQQRFPTEYELCVAYASNNALRRRLAATGDTPNEEDGK